MNPRGRQAGAGLALVVALGAGGIGCSSSTTRPAVAATSGVRAACVQASLEALTLSGRIGAASFAHRAAPSELAEVDTSIAALRHDVALLPTAAQASLAGLIDAASRARAALAVGRAPDAGAILRAQQQFAVLCTG